MGKSPAVVWNGSFDNKLNQLITIFASAELEERTELVSLDGLQTCGRLRLVLFLSPDLMLDRSFLTNIP
jgi:hypothetical protein